MKISGYFSEFSLGEVFRLLEQGQRTGCLSIKLINMPNILTVLPQSQEYYLFFRYGNVVAATTTLNQQGLWQLIEQRKLLHPLTIQRVMDRYSQNVPLGIFLKSQGILDTQQLSLLFRHQVLTPVPYLFSLEEGYFEFDGRHPLPFSEMTGLSASPQAITLAGLRLLRDWTSLMDKLPSESSTIVALVHEPPSVQLSAKEWQVWEQIDGTTTIQEIANTLGLPILEIQKICFCFIVMGLVEEIISISPPPATTFPKQIDLGLSNKESDNRAGAELSYSFLNGIVSFLRNKAKDN
ncbi:DUF4388 domain-containing protein [Thermosynechococcus sp. QS41]|uniref:DUF4388 domain-containing protein n=1 Tax=Thermosynechococcus sp. QS41 TaxID=3074101 RepID=UPI0028781122|nr:DUF4388 domain-containing protein [Thermosynechococcus sp. QS41]WNC60220.1 DUF4388 domain-containing protein [Thermosynechococcus sp. QS41]